MRQALSPAKEVEGGQCSSPTAPEAAAAKGGASEPAADERPRRRRNRLAALRVIITGDDDAETNSIASSSCASRRFLEESAASVAGSVASQHSAAQLPRSTNLSRDAVSAAESLLGNPSGSFDGWVSGGQALAAATAILKRLGAELQQPEPVVVGQASTVATWVRSVSTILTDAEKVHQLLVESLRAVLQRVRRHNRPAINVTCDDSSTAGTWLCAMQQLRCDHQQSVDGSLALTRAAELLLESGASLSACWTDRASGCLAAHNRAEPRRSGRFTGSGMDLCLAGTAGVVGVGDQLRKPGVVSMWDFLQVWTPREHGADDKTRFMVLVTPPDPAVHAVSHTDERGGAAGMLGGQAPAAIRRSHPTALPDDSCPGVATVRDCADRVARDAGCAWDGVLKRGAPSPRHWCRTAAPGARLDPHLMSRVYMDDLRPVVEALVDRHPDLEQLRDDVVSRSRYVVAVIVALFASVANCTTTSLTREALLRSNCINVLFICAHHALDNILPFDVPHVAQISRAFQAHAERQTDNVISTADLQRLNGFQVCSNAIQRIGSGRCRPLSTGVAGVWNIEDFAWLWHAAADRMDIGSLQYWFRALDRDDDGVLDRLDVECALDDREAEGAVGALPAQHATTRLMDLVRPAQLDQITALDISRSRSGSLVFKLLLSSTWEEGTGPAVRPE